MRKGQEMSIASLLVANRGEIAIRVTCAAADLGLRTVAVYSADDAASLHTRVADEAVALAGQGAAAYLDIARVVAAAQSVGCDAVHPGYGFLSEQADLARRCEAQGLLFVGPGAEHLALFGDKSRARQAAVDVAKQYLSYFQGSVDPWEAPEQRTLRHLVPENRVRLYDMREIIQTLADAGSVLEIREKFGIGVSTAFIRVEGRPMGVIANNPHHLADAIDSDGADKGARFLQLCDAFDVPVLRLMDCSGIMVGLDHERIALVRHNGAHVQHRSKSDHAHVLRHRP